MRGGGKRHHAVSRRGEGDQGILDAEGVGDMPLGLDVVEPPMLFECRSSEWSAGRPAVMLQAREVKNIDELTLLNMASAMWTASTRTSPRR